MDLAGEICSGRSRGGESTHIRISMCRNDVGLELTLQALPMTEEAPRR